MCRNVDAFMPNVDGCLLTAVQQSLDAKAYPPTHDYDVRTLEPRGVLAERVERLLQLCPDFFQAKRFLDVGASKGFFSLAAAQSCVDVVAIDPDEATMDLWAPLCPPNVEQIRTTFAGMSRDVDGVFDMIWMGNGHHYVHREDPENWVERLTSMALDKIIIEGPSGPDTPGFEQWEEGTVPQGREWLAQALLYGFHMVGGCPSPPYTPERYIWYLRKMT